MFIDASVTPRDHVAHRPGAAERAKAREKL
jgi:hypothetical protein